MLWDVIVIWVHVICAFMWVQSLIVIDAVPMAVVDGTVELDHIKLECVSTYLPSTCYVNESEYWKHLSL